MIISEKNPYVLSKIIDCIKFCGEFELALRGHDETLESRNLGIFRGLIKFTSALDFKRTFKYLSLIHI